MPITLMSRRFAVACGAACAGLALIATAAAEGPVVPAPAFAHGEWPSWNPRDEFEGARKRALRAAAAGN